MCSVQLFFIYGLTTTIPRQPLLKRNIASKDNLGKYTSYDMLEVYQKITEQIKNNSQQMCFTYLCGLLMFFIAIGVQTKMQMCNQFTSCLTIFNTRSMSFMSLGQFHGLSGINYVNLFP